MTTDFPNMTPTSRFVTGTLYHNRLPLRGKSAGRRTVGKARKPAKALHAHARDNCIHLRRMPKNLHRAPQGKP